MSIFYIYKIISKNSTLCYVGCTGRTLKKRLREHQRDFKRYREGKQRRVTTSILVLSCGDCSIELLEQTDEQDKAKCERKHVDSLPCVNKQKPTQTQKEWLKTPAGIRWNLNRHTQSPCKHCGKLISFNNIQRHYRTKKCLAVQANNNSDAIRDSTHAGGLPPVQPTQTGVCQTCL